MWVTSIVARNFINILLLFQPYYRQQLDAAAAYVRLEKERDQLRASLDQATERVAELEKALHESQERELACVAQEKTQVDRLLSLVGVLGGMFRLNAYCVLIFSLSDLESLAQRFVVELPRKTRRVTRLIWRLLSASSTGSTPMRPTR